jgi:hypothetical protein
MQRDSERMNALIIDGFRPLQFTYDDVVTQPGLMISTLANLVVSAHTT